MALSNEKKYPSLEFPFQKRYRICEILDKFNLQIVQRAVSCFEITLLLLHKCPFCFIIQAF